MSAHETGQRPDPAKENEENQTDALQRLDALERIVMRQQHELLRGLHGRVHELETTLAQCENDGR